MLFSHRCPSCGANFPAELGKTEQGKVVIQNLCPECEWVQEHVRGYWTEEKGQKVFKRDLPKYVPLTAFDRPLDKKS